LEYLLWRTSPPEARTTEEDTETTVGLHPVHALEAAASLLAALVGAAVVHQEEDPSHLDSAAADFQVPSAAAAAAVGSMLE